MFEQLVRARGPCQNNVRVRGSRPPRPRAGTAGSGVVWGSAAPGPAAVAVFPRRPAYQRAVTNLEERPDDPTI